MSLTRRLAAGLPAAGVTIFAALALSGAPASASENPGTRVAEPAVMSTPCTGNSRDCPKDYGQPAGTATTPAGTPTGNADTPTRGHSSYGGESPTTPAPSPTTPGPGGTTPTAHTDTVPPNGVSPTTVGPTPGQTKGGGGVSPAGTLPLTGAPAAATVGLGALLVGAGIFAIWYSRRRSV